MSLHRLIADILAYFPKTRDAIPRILRAFRTAWLHAFNPEGKFLKCNGALVYCDFSSPNYSWYDGDSNYLHHELAAFTALFDKRPPQTILDIGAHWGFYPAFLDNSPYAQRIKRIIAVEADPSNQIILAKTLARISNIRVTQVNSAISNKDGYVNLCSGGGDCRQTYSSTTTTSKTEISAITLDSLVSRFLEREDVISHIKLDIDGAEPSFFNGGHAALRKFKPLILMEFWAKGICASGANLDAYWRMLQENYFVKELCFPERVSKPLYSCDLAYLSTKTMAGITNLILIPKIK